MYFACAESERWRVARRRGGPRTSLTNQSNPTAAPPCIIHLPAQPTAGSVLNWFRRTLCGEPGQAGTPSYRQLDEEAAAVPVGCEGLVGLDHFQVGLGPNERVSVIAGGASRPWAPCAWRMGGPGQVRDVRERLHLRVKLCKVWEGEGSVRVSRGVPCV